MDIDLSCPPFMREARLTFMQRTAQKAAPPLTLDVESTLRVDLTAGDKGFFI